MRRHIISLTLLVLATLLVPLLASAQQCQQDWQCRSGFSCQDNVCKSARTEPTKLTECQSDTECGRDASCLRGRCITLPCPDKDGDGYSGRISVFCGYQKFDCNDGDSYINAGATEICGNKIDENCDGTYAACAAPVTSTPRDLSGYASNTAALWANSAASTTSNALALGLFSVIILTGMCITVLTKLSRQSAVPRPSAPPMPRRKTASRRTRR